MKSTSIKTYRDTLASALHQCRIGTLALFEDLDETTFRKQAHPDFSPPGWHLGHIAFTEAYWILESCAGLPSLFPEYRQIFAADGLPKAERENLPTIPEILHYLHTVRTQVLTYLKTAPLDQQERLWSWLIQHESQHTETITFVLQIQRWHLRERHQEMWVQGSHPHPLSCLHPSAEMIEIPAGEFEMGNETLEALDNERPLHRVYLDTYWIDRYPVTCKQYREFMQAGGYQNAQWWSDEGWQWLEENPVAMPLYWSAATTWDSHPVCGISWYEAEAYARFVGKRLPTEAEWEKAASWDASAEGRRLYPWGDAPPDIHRCNHNNATEYTTPVNAYSAGMSAYGCYDLLGNAWEWTSSGFEGYAGFESYPYPGYSQAYFDSKHQVLRGGSWATRPWAMRCSFRNWYHPGVRQIFAGFRCAADGGTAEFVHPFRQQERLQIKRLAPTTTAETPEGSDIIQGLTQTPKTLPAQYFYDDWGSGLFEQICELPEYYPTRTETAILQQYAPEIAQITGTCELVELGSGSSTKTRLLLDAYQNLGSPLRYVPIDVSAGILESSARQLLVDYPSLQVEGLVSTYELALQQLKPLRKAMNSIPTKRMLFFLGSTLGNLNPQECNVFFSQITAALNGGEYFLLGIDLQKPKSLLEAAYNDSQGVTAEFNLNLLNHLNRRFQGNFNTQLFEHWAFYHQKLNQIEMHLRSLKAQTIRLETLDLTVELAAKETIMTEISRKFDLGVIQGELQATGLKPLKVWTDPQQWFGLILCQL